MRVEIEDLHIAFPDRSGAHQAVRGVDLAMGTEKLGIVGESGSGKSLTARAILRLLPARRAGAREKLLFDDIDSHAPRPARSPRSAAAAPG